MIHHLHQTLVSFRPSTAKSASVEKSPYEMSTRRDRQSKHRADGEGYNCSEARSAGRGIAYGNKITGLDSSLGSSSLRKQEILSHTYRLDVVLLIMLWGFSLAIEKYSARSRNFKRKAVFVSRKAERWSTMQRFCHVFISELSREVSSPRGL